jgi:hypothetical protein
MTVNELQGRVTIDSALAIAALSLGAAWLGGGTAVLGVIAGGTIAVVNFRWLSRRASAVCEALESGGERGWLVGLGLRFTAITVVCTALFLSGWVHPVGVVVGLTVLPCDLIARGLAAAREAGRA